MHDLLHYCHQLSPLTVEAQHDLLQCIKTKTWQKGEQLLEANKVCRHLYFVQTGMLKMYFHNGDKEFIARFFPENVLFTAFESYLPQQPSKFVIETLELSTITRIGYDDMEALCKKHHCMETLLRKLVSLATIKMTKRIREMLEENTTELYNQFMQENSKIAQRLSLGDIARYLGITQQSLSRIRAAK